MTCHFCDQEGHVIRDCREFQAYKSSRSGTKPSQASGGRGWAASAAMTDRYTAGNDHCLSMPSRNVGNLPRVYLNVQAEEGVYRAKAAVDTCSSRCLVAKGLVDELQLQITPSDAKIMAINGSSLQILDEMVLQLGRDDENVCLPKTSNVFPVVPDLCSLNVDLIVGHDLIASVGGVNMSYEDGVLARVVFGDDSSNPPIAAGATSADDVNVLKEFLLI